MTLTDAGKTTVLDSWGYQFSNNGDIAGYLDFRTDSDVQIVVVSFEDDAFGDPTGSGTVTIGMNGPVNGTAIASGRIEKAYLCTPFGIAVDELTVYTSSADINLTETLVYEGDIVQVTSGEYQL